MSLGALLWSFEGRINRKPYWLAGIAVAVVMGILAGVVVAGAGALTGGGAGAAGIALPILALAVPFVWIALALGAKRLHDRDKSAWWLLVFFLLPALLEGAAEVAEGMQLVLALASLAISIWAVVELGFLRGTAGSNRYGPDPLARG